MNQVADINAVWEILKGIEDPEIPVISIVDLGIVRHVFYDNDKLIVSITPTYTGCPATKVIETSVFDALTEAGLGNFEIRTVISPPWTTDWLSEEGRQKLTAYGIAPPQGSSADKAALFAEEKNIPCPRCGSMDTEMISQFGSTPCKSLFRCRDCREPFDYFKCL